MAHEFKLKSFNHDIEKIRNPNIETRNKSEIVMTEILNHYKNARFLFLNSYFGIVSNFGFLSAKAPSDGGSCFEFIPIQNQMLTNEDGTGPWVTYL